jgi:hypothetical protein
MPCRHDRRGCTRRAVHRLVSVGCCSAMTTISEIRQRCDDADDRFGICHGFGHLEYEPHYETPLCVGWKPQEPEVTLPVGVVRELVDQYILWIIPPDQDDGEFIGDTEVGE